MSKILIWVGNFNSKKEFESYLDQSEFRGWWAKYDEDNLELSCQFCKELGIADYDEDSIIINYCPQGIDALLNHIPADTENIKEELAKKNIFQANAVICYNVHEGISPLRAARSKQVIYIGSYEFKINTVGTSASKAGLKYMLWLGMTSKTKEEFMEYFNQDEYLKELKDYEEGKNKKRPNPNLRCQFCKDLNIKFYYPEFLRIMFTNNESIINLVKRILDDDGFDDDTLKFLLSKYNSVQNANCIFCYIPNGYRNKKKDQNIFILKKGWKIDKTTPKRYLHELDNYNGLQYFITCSWH